MTMRPIVCSVDDSVGARAALRVASELADMLDARLVLVHVAPPTEAPGVSAAPAGQERLREAEYADARALLESMAKEAGLDDGIELRTATGSASERTVEISREEDAALVVLGSRGRGDLKSAVLGSVSHEIASNAPCPVVIVSPGAADRSLR